MDADVHRSNAQVCHKITEMPRNRLIYASLAVLTLLCGLATRPLRREIGPALAENLGDALWAMPGFWLLAFVSRRQLDWRISIAPLPHSITVGCIQLYHV